MADESACEEPPIEDDRAPRFLPDRRIAANADITAVIEGERVLVWGSASVGDASAKHFRPEVFEWPKRIVTVAATLSRVLLLDADGDVHQIDGRSLVHTFAELGKVSHISACYNIITFVTREGHVYTCDDCGGRDAATRVGLPTGAGKVAQAQSSMKRTLLLMEDGQVYAWAHMRPYSGPRLTQLFGETSRIAQIAAGAFCEVLLDDGGCAYMCCDFVQPTRLQRAEIPLSDERVAQVAMTCSHTALLTKGGRVYTFGRGEEGQLGLGDRLPRSEPTLVDLPEEIVHLAAGESHTVFLDASGRVYACGQGKFGQLGNGSDTDQLVPARVEGF